MRCDEVNCRKRLNDKKTHHLTETNVSTNHLPQKGLLFGVSKKEKNGSNPQTVATFRRKSHKLAYTIIQTVRPAQGEKRRIQKRIACGAHTSL